MHILISLLLLVLVLLINTITCYRSKNVAFTESNTITILLSESETESKKQ